MHYVWILMACGLIVLVASQGSSDAPFNSPECRANCSFYNNVSRDIAGNVLLPQDSLRRGSYEKCLEDCDKKSSEGVFGPDRD